ncbi:MAG: OHCU decarboxylase [Actinobacteria bacterium 13_2_20CM_2_71_6]|nr:MAG: OHCU decarboxylase [Actinobacteria bacterium 13_2_20CM_2_71_6]
MREGTDGLVWFNGLPREDAERELRACCAARAWACAVAAGRPYPDADALSAAASAALAELTWPDIAEALEAHPRIGEKTTGGGRDAAWSRREQAAVTEADTGVRDALADANREYEQRFGHVFLVFANGRAPDELLAAARARLGHDPATEQDVVRAELARIVQLRLHRLVAG